MSFVPELLKAPRRTASGLRELAASMGARDDGTDAATMGATKMAAAATQANAPVRRRVRGVKAITEGLVRARGRRRGRRGGGWVRCGVGGDRGERGRSDTYVRHARGRDV